MVDDSLSYIERRVVLSGALAGLALGCVGCSEASEVADIPDNGEQSAEEHTGAIEANNDEIRESFGGLVDGGQLVDFHDAVVRSNGFLYMPEGRLWLVAYPIELVDQAKKVYAESMYEGLEAGVLALYQKCPHLGCRVPDCTVSQQFECPCHGSRYSNAGEYLAGPAPRGMDMFATLIVDGRIRVDTSELVEGLPRGVNITRWELQEDGCLGELST